MKREESLDREQNVSVSFSKRKEWPRKCTYIHTHKMQRSDTIRLRESFFDRFCRILLSFFFSFSFSRHVQYRLQKKKKKTVFSFIRLVNISRVRISQHSYFITCQIYIYVLNSIKKKLLQFFSYAYSPKRTQKLVYQSRVQEEYIFNCL